MSWNMLADFSGISRGNISEIKNGLIEPKLSTICKILAGMNISLVEFFNFDIDLSELS